MNRNYNKEVPNFPGSPSDMSRRGQYNLWQSRKMYIDDSMAEIDRLNEYFEGPFLRGAPDSPRLLPTLW